MPRPRRPGPPAKRTLPIHLVVLGGVIVVAVITVILLVWGGGDGEAAAALQRLMAMRTR